MMTKNYVENRAAALIRDHNAYRKMRYDAACKDYRTALDDLLHVAKRSGIEISYKVSRAGYLSLNK